MVCPLAAFVYSTTVSDYSVLRKAERPTPTSYPD